MMTPRDAWKLLQEYLEPYAGYECDEIDEAQEVIERTITEYDNLFSGGII